MEYLERLNTQLFLAINAGERPFVVARVIAVSVATYAIYLLPLLLIAFWLWGDTNKRGPLVTTVVGTETGLALNQIIGLLWFHPRPFMVPIGNTLMVHAADKSFPSDHMTFMVGIAIGLWWLAGQRATAILTGILACCVAWSRIYLGIHFPFDMAGALVTATLGLYAASLFSRWIEGPVMDRVILPIYRRLFSWPIAQGMCHP